LYRAPTSEQRRNELDHLEQLVARVSGIFAPQKPLPSAQTPFGHLGATWPVVRAVRRDAMNVQLLGHPACHVWLFANRRILG
jgi:hypothetical protein